MNRPLFCPRSSCTNHYLKHRSQNWYRSAGTYETYAFGTVQRFRCNTCGKYFSTQTFSIDYYTKRTLSYPKLFNHLITTSSIRDMARDLSVSVDVVLNKLSRLSRNCLAILQELQRVTTLNEDLAADGFESFTVSQFFPCHVNLLAGKNSQLLYWYDYVTLRRKGRMTDEQKRQREVLERKYRADPKGVELSFRRLYDQVALLICDSKREQITLSTDEHPAYQRAKKKNLAVKGLRGQGRFTHQRISSQAPRTRGNPLFSVNYLDRQFRKDLAEHVRETVCFGRNVNCAMDRFSIYCVYHNLKKPYRESQGDLRTHAEVAGVDKEKAKALLYGLFSRRAFASKVKPESTYRMQWNRRYQTPLKENAEYIPKHVAA